MVPWILTLQFTKDHNLPNLPRMKFSRSVNWPSLPFPSQHFPATKKRAFPNADFERLYDISSNNKMADRETAFDMLPFSLVVRPRRHKQRKLNGQVYSSVLFVPLGLAIKFDCWHVSSCLLCLLVSDKRRLWWWAPNYSHRPFRCVPVPLALLL